MRISARTQTTRPPALQLFSRISKIMPDDQLPEILAKLPLRISDVASRWAGNSPDHLALVEAAGAWTYAQLEAAIAETHSWLQESDIRPGDRAMIVCENCRAFVALLLALAPLWRLAGSRKRPPLRSRTGRNSRPLWRSPRLLHHLRLAPRHRTRQAPQRAHRRPSADRPARHWLDQQNRSARTRGP